MSEITIIDCQRASTYLGVSVKTIRRWAQAGKLHGKKVGTRGDWRFTHQELDKMISAEQNKYDSISEFLRENASDIELIASERHHLHIGLDNPRWSLVRKSRSLYIDVINLLSNNLDSVTKGRREFEQLSRTIAKKSLARELTIEETIDGLMYLKQAIWSNLESTDLLQRLSTADLHRLSRSIATYNDVITSQIAFAYHHHFAKGQDALRVREERYRTLFDSIDDAFCIIEMLYDDAGNAYDYRFVEVNKVFESVAHMKDAVGKTLFELVPTAPQKWVSIFDTVLKTGKSNRIIDYSASRDRWFDIRSTRVGGPDSRLVAQLFEDVTEQRQAEERQLKYIQLTTEHDQLIRINQAKDEFIGIASHQLRTPATAVKQYIGILLSGMAGDITSDQKKFLETAYNSNERQLNLINDLLKTAQIDAAAVTLNRSLYTVGSMVKQATAALQPAFKQRQQKVVFKDISDAVQANVDPIEMDLVLTNLLENASKYSHQGSTVTVTVERTENAVLIMVNDQGVGIKKADQAKVFDKFTRIANDLSDTVEGTGLGLYWVRQIVEMHGGTVTVTSKPGNGSTFTVRLLI